MNVLLSRIVLAAGLGALSLAGLASAEAPKAGTKRSEPRAPKKYSIEQFMATTSVGGASFSADEKQILFSSNETGIFNVYRVPAAGGPATAVTSSKTDSTYAVGYFPHDDRILYTRDQGGNELNHLFVRGTDGQDRDLTPGEKLKAAFQGWNRKGDAFWVTTNERNPKFFDLYRYDATTYERTLVYQDETGYHIGAVSDDGRYVALAKPITSAENEMYLWDAKDKSLKPLHGAPGSYSPEDFDPAATALYYLTDENGEFARVRRYDLASGKHEDVEKADWDVMYTYFSRGGKFRVTGINEDARTVIKLVEARSGAPVKLPALPGLDVTSASISKSDARMAFYASADRSPSNLYVYDFGASEPRRLTDTLTREVDADDLVDGEVVRFKSFDGMVIPSILLKPHQATPQAKAPALVWVHGGPGGQTRKGYSAMMQYLANHGYVVLGINNRGSSGYGKTFFTADDRKHGKEPLWDCVEGKNYLASLPYVDKDRIGIIGGSYGGYMVLAALAYKPQEFAVGVDIFGVSNWLRTLEGIPAWWEAQRLALYKELGDPVKDKAMLTEISPVFHGDKIRKPLFVVQGANDPRVIKAESDDIVAAVKKNNVPVEYVVFADEGHGFSKRENQIQAYGKIGVFLDKYLKAPPAARPAN